MPVQVSILDSDAPHQTQEIDTGLSAPNAACRLTFAPCPGASRIHVPVIHDGAVVFRIEVPVQHHTPIDIDLHWDPHREIVAACDHSDLVVLSADATHAPAPPLRPPSAGPLDLCVLIDGTMWDRTADTLIRLLDNRDAWNAHIQQLATLTTGLANSYDDLHLTAAAYGDLSTLDDLGATDLRPDYLLDPPQPAFAPTVDAAADLTQTLSTLRATSGADYVDGLAEALHACTQLAWRPTARKLLILSGDSPGWDLETPPPTLANYLVRHHDLHTEVQALHGRGIELVTIYHAPSTRLIGGADPDTAKELVTYTKEQFKRLATHTTEFSFEAQDEIGATMATRIKQQAGTLVTRGASYALSCEVRPLPDGR